MAVPCLLNGYIAAVGRLCERPGCSDEATMSFGFDADRLLVWISERQPSDDPMQSGSLCRRHADSMVVPRGWTLDDRRDPGPRLFRSKAGKSSTADKATKRSGAASGEAVAPARRRRRTAPTALPEEQLDLETDVRTVADVTGTPSDPDTTAPLPWWPAFDEHDDLGGVLAADSPLLARAFRGTDRRR
jgi:hypothetical protein